MKNKLLDYYAYQEFSCDSKCQLFKVIRWKISGMAEVYLEFDKKKMKNASVFEELISVFCS